ncbi:hypothetical protein QBC47DRAFT_431624, partial [Echria macrotheca]
KCLPLQRREEVVSLNLASLKFSRCSPRLQPSAFRPFFLGRHTPRQKSTMDELIINDISWATATADPTVESLEMFETDYFLVEFIDMPFPPSPALLEHLRVLAAARVQYLGRKVWLCRFSLKTKVHIYEHGNPEFAARIESFPLGFVVHPLLKDGNPEDVIKVQIRLHADVTYGCRDDLKIMIVQITGFSQETLRFCGNVLMNVDARRDQLPALAKIDEVYTIRKNPDQL